MKRILFSIVSIATLALLLVACADMPTSGGSGARPTIQAAPGPIDAPEGAWSALDAFAQSLSVPADDVTLVSYEKVEWPDACLGAASSDEMCAQVITPGYRLVVEHQAEQQVLHTNIDGTAWRVAP